MVSEVHTMAETQILIAARQSRLIKGRDQVSMERQDDTAVKYATEVGDLDPIIASDAGVSGSVSPFKRPDLGPYLSDNPPRPWTELVAATIDRLGRNARDLADLRNWCEDHHKKITILSPRMSWPPAADDFSSQIVWTVLEALAEIQLRQTRKQYADTRDFLRTQKSLIGRACWGFMIVGPKAKKTLAPDPSKSAYLLKMIEMAEASKTLRQIAEYLDSKGVAPKYNGHWAPRSVGDILRNESLHGVYRLNGKILLRHEGVISKERWDELQAKLDANPKRRGPTRNDPLMLTDLLYCDACGQIMHARRTLGMVKKDGSRSVWTYYRCDGTPRNPSTCRNTVRADFIEPWVDQWLDKAPLIDDEIKEYVYVPAKGHADEIQEIDDEIDGLPKDAPDYLTEVTRLYAERERLIGLGTEAAHTEKRSTGIHLRDYWPTLDAAGKRDYLRRADVKVYVTPDKQVRVEGELNKIIGALVV
jgi:site-specific DNA recombinase